MTVNKLTYPSKENAVQEKINEIIDNLDASITVDQTFDGTSANAQSGVAISGELASNYQAKLVSGTNIKTINNTSLLGSGDISVGTVTSVNNVSPVSGDVTLTASDVGALPDSTTIPALYSTTGSNIDGAMTQAKVTNMATYSNVVLVGSPLLENYVLSSFSISDYAQLSTTVSLGDNFEIGLKFTTGNSIQEEWIFGGQGNQYIAIQVNSSGEIAYNIGDGTNWYSPTTTSYIVQANTTYWVKLSYDGSAYTFAVSTDGTDYTQISNYSNSNAIPSCLLRFGIQRQGNNYFSGSIDLKECYIKINGSYWWEGTTVINNIDDIDKKFVNKSGDTMTGNLALKFSDLDLSTTASVTTYRGVEIKDTNGERVGRVEGFQKTNGDYGINIGAKVYGVDTYPKFELDVNSQGVARCSFPNTTCCDGQWVSKSVTIMSSQSLNGSTALTYTLSDVPNDGYKYEVLLTGQATSGSTSGNAVRLEINSDAVSAVAICAAQTRTSATNTSRGAVVLPLTTSRKIYVLRATGFNGTATLYMRGYRRIGTNS